MAKPSTAPSTVTPDADMLRDLDEEQRDIVDDLVRSAHIASIVFKTEAPDADMVFGVFGSVFGDGEDDEDEEGDDE